MSTFYANQIKRKSAPNWGTILVFAVVLFISISSRAGLRTILNLPNDLIPGPASTQLRQVKQQISDWHVEEAWQSLMQLGQSYVRENQLQHAIWVFEQAGEIELAATLTKKLEKILQTAEIVSHHPVGDGVTASNVVTLSNGMRAIYKQVDFSTEIAAYRLDRFLKLGLVPTTVERAWGQTRGSLQLWVENTNTAFKLAPTANYSSQFTSSDLFFFDKLVSNVDRHASNFLIGPGNRTIGIDHGRSFGQYGEFGPRIATSPPIPRFAVYKRLLQLDAEAINKLFSDVLAARLVAFFKPRPAAMVAEIQAQIAAHGEKEVFEGNDGYLDQYGLKQTASSVMWRSLFNHFRNGDWAEVQKAVDLHPEWIELLLTSLGDSYHISTLKIFSSIILEFHANKRITNEQLEMFLETLISVGENDPDFQSIETELRARGHEDLFRKIALKKLKHSADRPSINNIIDLMQAAGENPFGQAKGESVASLNQIRQQAVRFIVDLERTFPGAKLVFTDPTSGFLHDVVSAYYRSKGQHDRTLFLNVDSLQGLKPEDVTQRLVEKGLSLDSIESSHPIVFVTGFNHTSASTFRVVEALYKHIDNGGRKTRTLAPKLNGVQVGTGFPAGALVARTSFDAPEFLIEQSVAMTNKGLPAILSLDVGAALKSENWQSLNEAQKADFLADRYELAKAVASPEFSELVQAESAAVGFRFPTQRPAPFAVDRNIPGLIGKDTNERLLERLEFARTKMKILNATTFANQFRDNLAKNNADNPVALFTQIIELKKAHLFDERFIFPQWAGHHFAGILDKMAIENLDMKQLFDLLKFHIGDWRIGQVAVERLIKRTASADQFTDLISEFAKVHSSTAQKLASENVAHFISLNPNGSHFLALESVLPMAEVVEKRLALASSAEALVELVAEHAEYLKEKSVNFVLHSILDKRPSPSQMNRIRNLIGQNYTPYQVALEQASLVRSPQAFLDLLSRTKPALPESEYYELIDRTISNYFLKFGPTVQQAELLNRTLTEYLPGIQRQILLHASKENRFVSTLSNLSLVLRSSVWGGTQDQLRTLAEVYSGGNFETLYTSIVTRFRPTFAELSSFINELKLSGADQFRFLRAGVQSGLWGKADIARAIQIIDPQYVGGQTTLSESIQRLLSKSPTAIQVLDVVSGGNGSISVTDLQRLMTYLFDRQKKMNPRGLPGLAVELSKRLGNRTDLLAQYMLQNGESFYRNAPLIDYFRFLSAVELTADARLGLLESWFSRIQAITTTEFTSGLSTLQSLVPSSVFNEVLRRSLPKIASSNFSIENIIAILNMTERFSPDVHKTLWGIGLPKCRSFADFFALVRPLEAKEVAIQAADLADFLSDKKSALLKMNFSVENYARIVEAFDREPKLVSSLLPNLEQILADKKVRSAGDYIKLLKLNFEGRDAGVTKDLETLFASHSQTFALLRPSTRDLEGILSIANMSGTLKNRILSESLPHVADPQNLSRLNIPYLGIGGILTKAKIFFQYRNRTGSPQPIQCKALLN